MSLFSWFSGFGSTKGIESRDNFIFTGKTEERSDFFLNFLATLGIKRYMNSELSNILFLCPVLVSLQLEILFIYI